MSCWRHYWQWMFVVYPSTLQPLCGLPLSTYFSAVKLRWLIDNIESVKTAVDEGRCMFGNVDTWLLWVSSKLSLFLFLFALLKIPSFIQSCLKYFAFPGIRTNNFKIYNSIGSASVWCKLKEWYLRNIHLGCPIYLPCRFYRKCVLEKISSLYAIFHKNEAKKNVNVGFSFSEFHWWSKGWHSCNRLYQCQ